jgi:cysteine sulfinate desulfinase/cysteine desulfurase-like protein
MLKGTGHLMALKNIIEYIKQKGIPIITDYAKAF